MPPFISSPLNDNIRDFFRRLTTQFQRKFPAFAAPVVDDWPDLKEDYLRVIKEPIALTDVQKKLQKSFQTPFKEVREVIKALSMITENCLTYNGKDSELSLSAIKMREEWHTKCLTYATSRQYTFPGSVDEMLEVLATYSHPNNEEMATANTINKKGHASPKVNVASGTSSPKTGREVVASPKTQKVQPSGRSPVSPRKQVSPKTEQKVEPPAPPIASAQPSSGTKGSSVLNNININSVPSTTTTITAANKLSSGTRSPASESASPEPTSKQTSDVSLKDLLRTKPMMLPQTQHDPSREPTAGECKRLSTKMMEVEASTLRRIIIGIIRNSGIFVDPEQDTVVLDFLSELRPYFWVLYEKVMKARTMRTD